MPSSLPARPDADWDLALAASLEAHRASHPGELLAVSTRRAPRKGPLAGVAVLVKDNIECADLPTTAGSLALSDLPTGRDAAILIKLRTLGAHIAGTTNLSEWANFRGSHSISGWSARGGLCRNPAQPDHSAGGSSSGSAAAVALGLVPLAIGTETDGSVLCPASLCGVAGYKSSPTALPTDGVIPLAKTQDSIGFFASTAEELYEVGTLLLAPASRPRPRSLVVSERLTAIVTQPTRVRFLAAVHLLASRGVAVETREGGEGLIPDEEAEMTVLLYECGRDLDAYLTSRRDPHAGSLAALIARNEELADEELALFGQDLLEAALWHPPAHDAYLTARAHNLTRTRAALDELLQFAGAVALPTMDPAWLIDLDHGDPPVATPYSAAAVAGYPAVHLPLGTIDGLPVGMTLIAGAGEDLALLELAAHMEALLAQETELR